MKHTFSEKLFRWPLFIIIFGWLVGIFFSSLIPSDSYLLVSIILSILISSVFSVAVFFRIKDTNLKISQAFLLIPIFYISTYCAVTFAVPLLFGPIFNTPETLVIKVLDKWHNYKTACRGIDIGVKLKVFPTRAFCLDSNLWQKIDIGRNIEIIGTKSPFGFYIENIQILSANKSLQPTAESGG